MSEGFLKNSHKMCHKIDKKKCHKNPNMTSKNQVGALVKAIELASSEAQLFESVDCLSHDADKAIKLVKLFYINNYFKSYIG
jgi:hypothetical protein